MKPFFDNPEKLRQLNDVAARWVGTPFVPHGAVCQAGADCVQLCAQLYLACGVMPEFSPGKYSVDAGNHNAMSQVLGWLDRSPYFIREFHEAQPGDLLVMNLGRVEHHVGLLLTPETFIHALRGRGAMITVLDAMFRGRITHVYRPIQPD